MKDREARVDILGLKMGVAKLESSQLDISIKGCSIKDCPSCKHPVMVQRKLGVYTISGTNPDFEQGGWDSKEIYQCLTCGSKFTCEPKLVCELID